MNKRLLWQESFVRNSKCQLLVEIDHIAMTSSRSEWKYLQKNFIIVPSFLSHFKSNQVWQPTNELSNFHTCQSNSHWKLINIDAIVRWQCNACASLCSMSLAWSQHQTRDQEMRKIGFECMVSRHQCQPQISKSSRVCKPSCQLNSLCFQSGTSFSTCYTHPKASWELLGSPWMDERSVPPSSVSIASNFYISRWQILWLPCGFINK